MTVQPTDHRDVYRAAEDEAARRHAVKQRALELKRALLDSTLRLAPERAAVVYNMAARRARGAPLLRLCAAMMCGALSMWVPIPSTSTLQGELTRAEPSQLDAAHGTTVARRALVYAHPAQCARLSLDAPAAIFVDGAGDEAARLQGVITRLALRAGSGDAACQIEMQLRDKHEAGRALAQLPAASTLTAVVPMQASSWLDVVFDGAARDEGVHRTSGVLKGLGEAVGQRSVILVQHLRNNQRLREHWQTLRQIFEPEDQ